MQEVRLNITLARLFNLNYTIYMEVSNIKLLLYSIVIINLIGCGAGPKVIEVPGPSTTVEVEVPGPTVEVLVPVEPEEEPAVTCQVFTDLSSSLISQTNNTSKFLPLIHSVKGDIEIGLESMTLTEQSNDSLSFDEFIGTDAEEVTKNFALRCNFEFEVKNVGTHTFSLNSDDGSQLYVNGVKVVDNGGSHGMTLKTGNVSLPIGIHSMMVLYYQGNGVKGLEVSVKRPALIQPEEDL